MAPTDPEEAAPTGKRRIRDAEATRAAILDAGRIEFAERGLKGARIHEIARRANCNKAMIYHYFSNKDHLFAAALEATYADIRAAEVALDLTHKPPKAAMKALIGFSFDYVSENPQFIAMINEENLHKASHLAQSQKARALNSPLVGTIAEVLAQGEREGVFRSGVDPVQLYISIAGICYFYIANRATLSAIFELPAQPDDLRTRRAHAIAVIIGYLRPEQSETRPTS